jgi:hypothetical protein
MIIPTMMFMRLYQRPTLLYHNHIGKALYLYLCWALMSSVIYAQMPYHKVVEKHRVAEITFRSATNYAHPIKDVVLRVVFKHTSGRTIVTQGFWNGNVANPTAYAARFAPPLVGTWHYTSQVSDSNNSGLHGITGTLTVQPYTGTNPLYAKGCPTISPNRRHLTFANGEPFFYLGDTAWEMACRSTLDEAGKAVYCRP